jgi:hypothetical protein
MSDGRHYSEKETALILRKAALLQAQEKAAAPAPSSGYSLADLEAAAGEAGLSPEYVRRAAGELGLSDPSGRPTRGGRFLNAFLGGHWKVEQRLVVDRAATREELDDLILSMGEIFRAQGSGNASQKGLSWNINSFQAYNTGFNSGVKIQLRADGKTEIAVGTDLGGVAGGLYGGLMGGMGLGVGVGAGLPVAMASAAPGLLGAAIAAGALGGSYIISRLVYGLCLRKAKRDAARIVGEIAGRLSPQAAEGQTK